MKKYIAFVIGVIIAIFTTRAAEITPKDTTIRFNRKVVQLEDSVGQIKVKVYDENSEPFNKIYEGIFTDDKSYEKWTVAQDLGIQLPFLNKIQNNKKNKNYSMEPHWAGIGWGFANISDAEYNLNNIDGVTLKSEKSNEFYFNFIEKILPIFRNNIGLTSGFGMSWHNYFLDRNKHLLEVDDLTGVYNAPTDVVYEYSRLRVFQLNVPLLLEWQPTFGRNRKFFISAGVVAGVNTSATYKVKYKNPDTGKTVTSVESRGLNIAPLSLDYMAQIGYGSWSVYAKYSPFSMFQSEKGPDVRAVSMGATLNF
ncbi:MAG: hypothetical protein H6Q20_500 [Bacteroidetes bacterium]|jgi:hypothetical protein|nr:hypothetical protein [Bacteroidota bacterium]